MNSTTDFDFVVIGAGIAGSSVAAELAAHSSVLLLEMESQPGYHTTGRSAAMYAPIYGPKPIRALTRASHDFFHNPKPTFTDAPLLSQRDILMIARADQQSSFAELLSELASEGTMEVLTTDADIRAAQPLLKQDYAQQALLDRGGKDIDVNALHHGYLRQFKALGGQLALKSAVSSLTRINNKWHISAAHQVFKAPVVVNAAGAWADQNAKLAGAEYIGLMPKRRTVAVVAAPEGRDCDHDPITIDIDEEFYLKPDAGRLMLSPANEDASEPCDVQPDEMDIAICIDRIERAFDLKVRRIENKWAGLRSFVADKCPVAGFSTRSDGFFWLAGQGGYGIQTAPALSRFSASLLLGNELPADILAEGLNPAELAPDRLQQTA